MLVFYPMDFSPACTDQLNVYQEVLAELEAAGAKLYGVSVDSAFAHKAFQDHLGVSIPLLADFHPKGEVAKAYGVYIEERGHDQRALVMIGPDLDGQVGAPVALPAGDPGRQPHLRRPRAGLDDRPVPRALRTGSANCGWVRRLVEGALSGPRAHLAAAVRIRSFRPFLRPRTDEGPRDPRFVPWPVTPKNLVNHEGLGSLPACRRWPGDDHVRGQGPLVIEYADLECPYCARAHLLIRDLPIRRVFRHFPMISKHPRARVLAAAAEAAAGQGRFWEFHRPADGRPGAAEDPHLWDAP